MNPTILQGSYHQIPYPLNTDKYTLDPDRGFANPGAFAPNDCPYFTRRPPDGLTNAPLGVSSSVSTSTGLDYNQSAIDHSPYSSSQVLLSPPSSIDGSFNGIIQPSSSSFDFSGTSRLLTSNASSTDHYSSVIPQYPDPPWSVAAMTDFRPPKPQVLQPQIAPALGYPLLPHSFTAGSSRPDPFSNQATYPRAYNGQTFNGPPYKELPRDQPFPNPISTFNTYPPNHSYHSMPNHQPPRPEGPPFDDTKIIHTLVTGRNQPIGLELSAIIQKGFFQVDGRWTCYRRNYFSVQCAFSFKNPLPDGQVFVQRQSQMEAVQQFSVSLSAKTANVNNQESETRQLVQHTPKRDKATETIPGRHVVQPATVQSLSVGAMLPNAGLYPGGHPVSSYDNFTPHSQGSIPTSYTFERIQFQKATANNGKRRAQQQFFHIVVELSVNVARSGQDDTWVVIATRQSHPMVVRGRSPGHYKDNPRRDSQTHMDPDRGSGRSGDRGPPCLPGPQFLGGGQSSTFHWAPQHRQSHNYGGSYSQYTHDPASSPLSASSYTTTLTNSPVESESRVLNLAPPPTYRAATTLRSNHDDHSMLDGDRRSGSTKRSLEVDVECEHGYYNSNANAENNLSPRSFNLTNVPSVKSLCASS